MTGMQGKLSAKFQIISKSVFIELPAECATVSRFMDSFKLNFIKTNSYYFQFNKCFDKVFHIYLFSMFICGELCMLADI